MSAQVRPLAELNVVKHFIRPHGIIPNSEGVNKPLFIYQSVFAATSKTADMEAHMKETGVVVPSWRYTMYSQDHFHSTTHEVLAIAKGKAKLCFGHADNPGHVVETVKVGDVILIPAGVSHRLVEDLTGGFLMVGCYPKGKQWDMCYGQEEERHKIDAIRNLAWFTRDPIYGDKGPSLDEV